MRGEFTFADIGDVGVIKAQVTSAWLKPGRKAMIPEGRLGSIGISAGFMKQKDGGYRYFTRKLKREYRVEFIQAKPPYAGPGEI